MVDLERSTQLTSGPEIRDVAANRSEYEPKPGLHYLSTDTGARFIGDGERWTRVESTGANPSFRSLDTDALNSINQVHPSDDLQTQIDNEGANTRHVLVPGDHDLGASVVIVNYDKVEIVGPRDAVLQFSSSTTATFIRVGVDTNITHFLARGFTIDGTNQTAPASIGNHNSKDGCGIYFDEPTGVDIRDYRVEGVRFYATKSEAHAHFSDGIAESNDPGDSHGVVTNCLFEACEGYAASHCHNDNTITIENNTFRDCSNIGHIIRHGKIRSNTFESCSTANTGTVTESIIVGSDEGGIIANNTIQFCTANTGILAAGDNELIEGNVLLDNTVTAGIQDETETSIHNNRVRGSGTTYGIRLKGGNADVQGNKIQETGERGIFVKSNNNILRDNTVLRAGQSVNREGIVINGTQTGNLVKDNEVRGSTRADGLVAYDGPNRIIGNTVEKSYSLGSSVFARENNRAGTTTLTGTAPSMPWHADVVLLDASGNTVDAVLPDPTLYPGEEFTIKRVDGSANTCKYSQNGTETIDGSAEQTLSAQYDAHTVESDGTNWNIVASA